MIYINPYIFNSEEFCSIRLKDSYVENEKIDAIAGDFHTKYGFRSARCITYSIQQLQRLFDAKRS